MQQHRRIKKTHTHIYKEKRVNETKRKKKIVPCRVFELKEKPLSIFYYLFDQRTSFSLLPAIFIHVFVVHTLSLARSLQCHCVRFKTADWQNSIIKRKKN